MKIALVGFGYWGRKLLTILTGLSREHDFTVAWVCDHNPNIWDKYEEEYPDIFFDVGFDDLLENHKVDAVFIATQPTSHYSLTKRSLENGCHVFVEKPFIGKLNQAIEIAELSANKSLRIMVGYRLIYSPSIALFKEKYFPKIRHQHLKINATWKNWGRHQAGGVHWDLASHLFAVLNYLHDSSGKVIEANTLNRSNEDLVEEVNVLLEYPNSLARINVNWNSSEKCRQISILSDELLFLIDFDDPFPLIVFDSSSRHFSSWGKRTDGQRLSVIEKHDKGEMIEKNGIEHMIIDFIRSIRTGSDVKPTLKIALEVIDSLNSVEESIKRKI